MILLKETEYYKVVLPLSSVTTYTLAAWAVVDRVVQGEIYVDNRANPAIFYIVHPHGMSLLFGNTENTRFNEQIFETLLNKRNIPNRIEGLLVFPEDWKVKFQQWLGDYLIKNDHRSLKSNPFVNHSDYVTENVKVIFKFEREKYDEFRRQVKLDDNRKIIKLDEKSYEDDFEGVAPNIIPKHFWKDASQFLAQGGGYGVMCDGEGGVSVLASIAFAIFVKDNILEIGIATKPAFRKRGFALSAAIRLIDDCLERGFTPLWSCRFDNLPFYTLAQKIGFQPESYLPSFRLRASPFPPMLQKLKGIPQITKQQYKEFTNFDVVVSSNFGIVEGIYLTLLGANNVKRKANRNEKVDDSSSTEKVSSSHFEPKRK